MSPACPNGPNKKIFVLLKIIEALHELTTPSEPGSRSLQVGAQSQLRRSEVHMIGEDKSLAKHNLLISTTELSTSRNKSLTSFESIYKALGQMKHVRLIWITTRNLAHHVILSLVPCSSRKIIQKALGSSVSVAQHEAVPMSTHPHIPDLFVRSKQTLSTTEKLYDQLCSRIRAHLYNVQLVPKVKRSQPLQRN